MMRRLCVETATTGRFLYREKPEHIDQPHMCRLGFVVVDDGDEAMSWCKLIRPRAEWVFDPDAEVANGISREIATKRGTHLSDAMNVLRGAIEQCDMLIAFNLDHHGKVLQRAAFDAGQELIIPARVETVCAMRQSTDVVKKHSMRPGGGYAWPKQGEAYHFFTGLTLPAVDVDPVARGLAFARATLAIHDGILQHRRVTHG